MKKLVWIRKLRCFVRVARLKKARETLENHIEKNNDFHEKSTPYRVKKTDQNKNTIKIGEKMLPGHFVNPQVDF